MNLEKFLIWTVFGEVDRQNDYTPSIHPTAATKKYRSTPKTGLFF